MRKQAVFVACLLVGACRQPSSFALSNDDLAMGLPPVGGDAVIFAPGVVSTGDVFASTFTPDGRTVVFTKFEPPHMTLMSSTRIGNTWSAPVPLPFSGTYRDLDPAFAPDGKRLYFSSWRPTSRESSDTSNASETWYAERTDGGWSEPMHLRPPINSPEQDYFPSVTRRGVVYFDSFRSTPRRRLVYRATPRGDGSFAEAEALDTTVNADSGASNLFVDPDERYVVFGAVRPEGRGGVDLYVSWRRGNSWTTPLNLGDRVNSAATEFCPFVSRDGRFLYFTRNVVSNGRAQRNIFVIRFDALLDSLRRVTTATPPPLWGNLVRGSYEVGYTQRFERDTARPAVWPDSLAPMGGGRPMQIHVWYPARSATDTLRLRDYVVASAGVAGREFDTPSRRQAAVDVFTTSPSIQPEWRASMNGLLETPLSAARDAPPARGRFPLLVFLHSTPWSESVMSEYLASYGFVVAAVESKGAGTLSYRLSRENLDAMVSDAAFVVARMRREENVDQRLGVIGMSNGSIAAMGLELTGPVPDAVVSLDGGIGESAGGTYLAERSNQQPGRFSAPLLHLYSPDNSHLDLQYLRSYTTSTRTLVSVGRLRHADFLTSGAVERLFPGAFGVAPANVPLGFDLVCRYTLAFLRRHVANDSSAARFLESAPEANGAPADFLRIERLPARAP